MVPAYIATSWIHGLIVDSWSYKKPQGAWHVPHVKIPPKQFGIYHPNDFICPCFTVGWSHEDELPRKKRWQIVHISTSKLVVPTKTQILIGYYLQQSQICWISKSIIYKYNHTGYRDQHMEIQRDFYGMYWWCHGTPEGGSPLRRSSSTPPRTITRRRPGREKGGNWTHGDGTKAFKTLYVECNLI